ncbi:MAG: gliding motility protein GldM [Bacteroidetes bacterium]|nr:gliding motility protein GldM [Bacteroidota bacterium]
MAGGKQTPRQKMIGMMYLVLTALLALNISKEIINSFIVIEEGLVNTNRGIDGKNGLLYQQFASAMANDEKKAKPLYDKAMKVKEEANKLFKYIQDLKAELKAQVEFGLAPGDKDPAKIKSGDTLRAKWLTKPDDYDIPTNFMIGDDPASIEATKPSAVLKKKLAEYKKFLLGQLDEKAKASIGKNLSILDTPDQYSKDNEKMVSWEWYNFYHMPVSAMLANLARIQNDIKNTEGDVVNELLSSINKNDFKFDAVAARVIAPTSYVLTGEKYTANILVAAYNSTQAPSVWLCKVDTVTGKPIGPIDSTTVKPGADGMSLYEVSAGSTGLQQWSGLIRVKKPDGTYSSYPFKSEYMVAAPSAAVSPTKMNVFYIGVDNPVSISAAGVAPSDITPSMTGGTITSAGKPGDYIVRVSQGAKATISVNAKLNGASKSMGSFEFRIKRVPDPVAYLGNIKGDGQMNKGELNAASGIFARMENFDFDLSFKVVSFVMSMNVNGVFVDKKANGPALTPEMKTLLASAKPGGKVFFEQITVQGPDGSLRKIPGVNIKVK